jgi:hypothetical protein
LNLNLVVQQVQFSVLPVIPLPFGSGSRFWEIPCRTGLNRTSATLIVTDIRVVDYAMKYVVTDHLQ